MPELAPWQDAFATTGPAFMATVRQSITALYEEAQRSAVAGAPMLAVLQSDAAGTDCLTDRTDTGNTIPVPATAIAMAMAVAGTGMVLPVSVRSVRQSVPAASLCRTASIGAPATADLWASS